MKALGAAVGGVVLLPVLVIAGGIGALGGGGSSPEPVSSPKRAEIPAPYVALYTEAAPRFSIPWEVLAGVGKVECDHGRDFACTVPNPVGAAGPMQFLPATWARWASASGDPEPSVYDPRDAVFAAAAKLAADGLALDPWAALRSYNPSDAYAATVVSWALVYGWEPPDADLLARAVLAHPRLSLRPAAAGDVRAGVVDDRVLALLLAAATDHHLGGVGPLVSGHHDCVGGGDRRSRPGCTLSNHIFGRAADVGSVDGEAVSARNGGARAVLDEILALTGAIRPDEIGVPFPEYDPLPGVFSDADHRHHLHLGFES